MLTNKQLYIWPVLELINQIDELESYLTQGIVFALASSVEEARKLIMIEVENDRSFPTHLRKYSKPYLVEKSLANEPFISNSSGHIFGNF